MTLHGEIFLAAKTAAVGRKFDAHLFRRQTQNFGDLFLVLIDTLALGENLHTVL